MEELHEIEHVLPEDIEARSFEIIREELRQSGKALPDEYADVLLRVIHATADLSYADTFVFSENAMELAERLLRTGAQIVTDTTMALAGINKRSLSAMHGEGHCLIADEEVAAAAKKEGETRSAAAVTVSLERFPHERMIYVCGNAPTALLQICEEQKKGFVPALVIGVPVGFVNVVQAKERLIASGIPYIVNRGRKGGSNVAAAVVNALMYRCMEADTGARE